MSDETFSLLSERLQEFDQAYDLPYSLCFGRLGEATLDINLKNRLKSAKRSASKGSLGLHTNGLLLEKDYGILENLDFLTLSILGGVRGEYTFKNITGLNLDQHLERIVKQARALNKSTFIILTLQDFSTREEVDIITKKLEGSGVIISLNPLILSDSGAMVSKANTSDDKIIDDLVLTGSNGLSVVKSAATYDNEAKNCLMLAKTTAISVNGSYGLCCFPAFGTNNIHYSVRNTKLVDFVNGPSKQNCKKFLTAHQKTPINSCADCLLPKTFGVDQAYENGGCC
jgi:hypothetical protein